MKTIIEGQPIIQNIIKETISNELLELNKKCLEEVIRKVKIQMFVEPTSFGTNVHIKFDENL